MAGHSKFKNIMHRKGAQDKKRSAQFSKLSREITVAAKMGMPDVDMNPRLRAAVNAAKAQSVPKDNIQRAIDKATKGEGDNYEEVRYEGYGPAPDLGVGLGLADDLVANWLLLVVEQRHGRPEHDPVTRKRGRIDNLGPANLVLNIGDRHFDLALPLLGRMIFGIFGQVAMRARLLDRLDDPGPLFAQGLELTDQLFVAFRQHRHPLGTCHCSSAFHRRFRTPQTRGKQDARAVRCPEASGPASVLSSMSEAHLFHP